MGPQPSINPQGVQLPPSSPFIPQQSPAPNQQTDFYQNATEAMSVHPNNPNTRYQRPFPTTPPSGAYPPQGTPGQYGHQVNQPLPPQVQPLQTGNYAGQGYTQQPIQGKQGYHSMPAPPQKQHNGAVIFIISICLVIALLSVVGIGTLYVLKGHNTAPKAPQTQGLAPTATTAPTPTMTIVATATPDAQFTYCGQPCVTNGFSTEYPQAWSATPLTGVQGIQFANPEAVDQSATFKTPEATTGAPSDLVASDLQQNFATKNGYTVVTPESTAYIGGETWFKEVVTYQGVTQKEHVEVYANVHQSKAYILELQAPEEQFMTINTQYFENITGRFLFQ
ncbi:MAG: hypothetical protein NVSMB38_02350 [Ktedonobacteraceae bacterium]